MSAPEKPALGYADRVDLIDVSAVQTAHIDWAKVAAAGFKGVIAKVAEGVAGVDQAALANLKGARAAGLRALVYIFVHESQPADAQADNLWKHCGDTVPDHIAIDVENAPDDMSAHDIATNALAVADAIEQRFGRPPIIYTYPDFDKRRILPALAASSELADAFARLPLWMATYGDAQPWVPGPDFAPDMPAPWKTWALHQYSGNGGFRVPGVPGDCDRDLFNGDMAAFRRFCGLPDVSQSDPTIPFAPVSMPPVEIVDDSPDTT